jgi:hypothetical protein
MIYICPHTLIPAFANRDLIPANEGLDVNAGVQVGLPEKLPDMTGFLMNRTSRNWLTHFASPIRLPAGTLVTLARRVEQESP